MKTITELEKEVKEAMTALDCADKECAITSGKRTTAINNANNAQSEFDHVLKEIRASTNRATDWGRVK